MSRMNSKIVQHKAPVCCGVVRLDIPQSRYSHVTFSLGCQNWAKFSHIRLCYCSKL